MNDTDHAPVTTLDAALDAAVAPLLAGIPDHEHEATLRRLVSRWTAAPAVAPGEAPLTPTQLRVVAVIDGYTASHGRAPSVREIGQAMGGRSTNAVIEMLDRLGRKGVVTRDPHAARSVRVVRRSAA